RFRVMQVNQMRGLLYEFGVVLPQGRRASIEAARAALATLADHLPAMLTESLQCNCMHGRLHSPAGNRQAYRGQNTTFLNGWNTTFQ
ncbi:hypothetical protein PQR41_46005, partial [Paraburkholderia xenovorans]